MWDTKEVALWYPGKLCLCQGWNVTKWPYATKAKHVGVVNKMLGFVEPSQFMSVPRT